PLTANPFFRKTFDTRDPGDLNPSIQNLRMADNISGVADPSVPGNDFDLGTPGYQTQVPIVTWDPVLGASAYEVEVGLCTGGACTATVTSEYWDSIVATNAWTPLGPHPDDDPWPNHGRNMSHDGSRGLVAGHDYCVRVRAFTDQGYDQNHILKNVVGD